MIYTDFLALRAVRRISTSAYAKRYRSELQEAIDAIEQCHQGSTDEREPFAESAPSDATPAVIAARSEALLQSLTADDSGSTEHEARLESLQRRFELQPYEGQFLDHYAHCQVVGSLQSLMRSLDATCFYPHDARLVGLMAVILDVDAAQLRQSASNVSALVENGLVSLDCDGELRGNPRVGAWFTQSSSGTAVDDIEACLLGRPSKAQLNWSEVSSHVEGAGLLQRLLQGALERKEQGINILIHGLPGTGKTEFVKSLAQSMDTPLFLAAEVDEQGAEPTRGERLASLKLSDRLLGGRQALLMADEADDVLGSEGLSLAQIFGARRSLGTGSKVYLNRLLETNRCPVIWVLNDAESLPITVLRRMSMVIVMDAPPLGVRQRIWHDAASTHALTGIQHVLERCAGDARLSPAIAQNALRAVSLAGGSAQELQQVISGMVAVIAPRSEFPDTCAAQTDFNPERINCRSPDWAQLKALVGNKETIRQSPLSILISGVPGTGKSLYARQLAEQLGMRARLLRPSDILSPMVGESEQQLAAAFKQAIQDHELLIIDEVDSFLTGRRADSKTWERTLVNELLTHLERHPIPIVCTTNHLDCIDQAALRRFLFQLQFDPMTRQQSRRAVEDQWGFELAARDVPDELVPADIARLGKRYRVLGIAPDPQRVLNDLASMRNERSGAPTTVGFVSTQTSEITHDRA
tara:strand:+ start:12778 stop:14868 length:2091 start_codon:yes stop_codon:yes gene_type:complete